MDYLAKNHRSKPVCTVLRLLLLFCLSGMLSSCSSADHIERVRHSEWSANVHLSEWPEAGVRGLGIGFVQPEFRELSPLERPSTHTFHVQQGEPFAPLLILVTGYSEPYPVLVSVFLDYRQVRFVMDGRQGHLHYLKIEPGVNMEIPIEVPIQTPGWHDLFVVAFREPNYHPTDPQERLPPALAVGGRRAVVCVEDCTIPDQPLPDALGGEKTLAKTGMVNAFPLLPDKDKPPMRRLLLSVTASPGETLALELWGRNTSDTARRYVVLPLLDYQQIPFGGSSILHLHMPPGSELFLDGQIKVPDKAGVHELQFVSIFDPYRSLDEVIDPFVQSVMRSAIVVESE